MSSRLRAAVTLLLASALCASCSGSSEPTTTVTATATETATAKAVTVTPSPATSTVTGAPGQSPTSRTSTPTSTAGGSSPAISALGSLPGKGRAPKTGYDRAEFGQPWSDAVTVSGGHNGCDTRNDVLRRDLTGITLDGSTGGCVVLRGTLQDPYTGTSLAFVRGPDTSRHVHIDHVALSNAWQTGAQQLDEQQREDFANDPLNLLAVQGTANQRKGDGDAATWLPSRKAYRCDYAARQVAVKQRHDLWVTPPEREALRRILSGCPDQSLPTASNTGVPSRGDS